VVDDRGRLATMQAYPLKKASHLDVRWRIRSPRRERASLVDWTSRRHSGQKCASEDVEDAMPAVTDE
jgi:hypothetical protein